MPVDLSHVTRIHCHQGYRNASHWEGRTINDTHSPSRSLKNGRIVRHVIAKGLWRIPIRMGDVHIRWRYLACIDPPLAWRYKIAHFAYRDSKVFRQYVFGNMSKGVTEQEGVVLGKTSVRENQ